MIQVFPDPASAVAALAGRIAAEAGVAIGLRGEFRIALSGGETPVALYRLLSTAEWRDRIEWRRSVLLFADERAMAVGAPGRTDRLVFDALLEPLRLPASLLRPMRGEAADLETAARDYEPELANPLDLLLLGAGPDGHIASLFPNAPALSEAERRVIPVYDSPKPPPRRITLAPRSIAEARNVCVLAAGEAKAQAVASALDPATRVQECPAALVRDRDWYIDRAAASRCHEA